MSTFYLGTHQSQWLGRTDVPLFVSHRRLAVRKRLPRASGPWALDSGGFTELSLFGGWQTPAHVYASAVRRYADEIGGLQWAAPQDWMCEPFMLAKTGKTLRQHQLRTLWSVVDLRSLHPELPWAPVLQGWGVGDYLRAVDDYARAGFDLAAEPVVGVGSVCRRQATTEARVIVRTLREAVPGIRLHLFGAKVQGLPAVWRDVASSDSLAWSFQARRNPGLPGCTHASCANCLRYALDWRARLLDRLGAVDAQEVMPWAA